MASRYESDMTRKEKMQLEKEKLSKMNFKEKLAYIWEYYKAVIFGIIAVIFIIGTIVNIHENAKYYDLVSIAVVDYAGLQDVSPIEEDLKEALGTGDKYEKVSIDTSYSFGENLENADYNTLMKFTAVIAAQSMDVLICSQAVYDNYSKDDYFLDLSTLFDEATCEKYGIKAGDTCLDISKLKKYQDMGLTYYEPCYLTVVVNSKNTDNAAKLIEYLEEDGVMSDLYTEVLVKKQQTGKDKAIKGVLIFFTVLFAAAGIMMTSADSASCAGTWNRRLYFYPEAFGRV